MNDKYLHITLDELIKDDDFVQWVVSPRSEDDHKWRMWLTEHPELSSLFEEARKEIRNIEIAAIPYSDAKEEIWQRIEASTSAPTTSKTISLQRLMWPVAAAALIGLVLIPVFLTKKQTIRK